MKSKFSKIISAFLAMIIASACVTDSLSVKAAESSSAGYIDFSPYIVQSHPRLYVTSFEGLKEKYLSDPLTAGWYNTLVADVASISDGSVMAYDIDKLNSTTHIRRIIESQDVLDRFYRLAFVAAVEDSRALADRLWLEIEAAINLPNWHPGHWLETAEMIHSLSIAYDWCYKFWSDNQKQLMKDAMVEKGINHATREYAGNQRWYEWVYGMDGTQIGTNWTIVCNTGVLLGSLAIFEEETELCNTMINNAVRSMKAGTNAYSADGSYRESFAYWNYATRNLIMAVDAFESAIGGDFDVLPPIEAPFAYDFSVAPGISSTPEFPIYGNGPAGVFNYGDLSGGSRTSSPAIMWIGERFGKPYYTNYHLDTLRKNGSSGGVHGLLWYGGDDKEAIFPQDRLFEENFASMRSSWNDNEAIYVTLKGGTNGRPHQHYDIGTFALDAFGTRFAKQLGAIGYDWSGGRENFYKARTEGQNSFVINPDEYCGQNPVGSSVFEDFYSGNESAYAILDMTGAYDKRRIEEGDEKKGTVDVFEDTGVTSARRGIKMYSDKSRVLVQDEVKMNTPSDYLWFMHTDAKINLYNNDRSAVLTLGTKALYLNVLSDKNAVFEIMTAEPLDTSPNPEDQPDAYGTKLAIRLNDITEATVAVEMIPSQGAEPVYSGHITPLSEWHPESELVRFGRELTIYGDDKPGRMSTMIVRSPLGYVYGIDQEKADLKGEYVFETTLPENYENGIYSVYLNGALFRTFEITDGLDAGVPSASYTISYSLPDGISSSLLVAAEYKDGCMVQLCSAQYDILAQSATVKFEYNPSKGNTLKFFYLESLDSLTPLYPASEMTVE